MPEISLKTISLCVKFLFLKQTCVIILTTNKNLQTFNLRVKILKIKLLQESNKFKFETICNTTILNIFYCVKLYKNIFIYLAF